MTHEIPDYDWNQAHIEWGRGLEFYQSRLRQLGFDNRNGLFLDAGCGTGQWMDAISRFGKEIVGIDVRTPRLEIASIFLDPNKAHLVRASLAALPFRENVFENVICYGVIMFLDHTKAFEGISKACRKGAFFYVCWNAIGWSLRLLVSPRRNRSIKRQALQTLINTWRNSSGTKYFSRRSMRNALRHSGFIVDALDGEGRVGLTGVTRSVYARRFLCFDNVLEALAVKE